MDAKYPQNRLARQSARDKRVGCRERKCTMSTTRLFATTPPVVDAGPKAERTRAAILAAAEDQFAKRGFVATRLEDVAAAVGLKRATLFYHFRDKQSLYDAVVAAAFTPLAQQLEHAFAEPVALPAKVEKAVEAWVDIMVARPTLARIILRHAAEAEEHAAHGLFPGAEALLRTGWSLFEQGLASGELQPVHEDPFHAASAVLGATVFFVTGFSALMPDANFSPHAPEQVETHKRNALRTLRLLLGIRRSTRTRATRTRATRATKASAAKAQTKAASKRKTVRKR